MTFVRNDLLGLGFKNVTYKDQTGQFLTLTTKVDDMPYAKEHLVDNVYIFGDSTAVIELTPANDIQICILDADYSEVYSLESDEGQALVRDALGRSAPVDVPSSPSPRV